jgi:hypothetical protein
LGREREQKTQSKKGKVKRQTEHIMKRNKTGKIAKSAISKSRRANPHGKHEGSAGHGTYSTGACLERAGCGYACGGPQKICGLRGVGVTGVGGKRAHKVNQFTRQTSEIYKWLSLIITNILT